MTSQSAIFDGIVNLIAPVEASLKSIVIRYIWIRLKFLLLTGEIVEYYKTNQKKANQNFENL